MSICFNSDFTTKSNYIKRYINTEVDVKQNIPFGFYSSIDRDGNENIYLHGKRNIERDLPFEKDSIYRMASQSKFMGVAGFVKLITQGKVKLSDPLKKYLPEYNSDRMGVIEVYQPQIQPCNIYHNIIYTKKGSNEIYICHKDNRYQDGDTISIEWTNGSLDVAKTELPTIHGIPGFELYNVHKIYDVTPDGYTIKLHTKATMTGLCGGKIKIIKVDNGVKRSLYLSPDRYYINPKVETYYYKTIPLKRDLTVMDVITHGLGWNYYGADALYMSFGYSANLDKRNIQAGIWNELGIPVGLPRSCYNCGIRTWVELASNIPLLYQPGEDWSYGPQISVLGALIEVIDKRPVEKYMKEELWDPLKMNNTGFFIHDTDPQYEDKVDRLCQLYINMPKIVIKFIGETLPFPPIYELQHCLYQGPRKLAFMDSGMYTTVEDYFKFMKMLLNKGKTDEGMEILSHDMIDMISKYNSGHGISNLETLSSYSSKIPGGSSKEHIITRSSLLDDIGWGLGIGIIKGCKNSNQCDPNNKELGITWGGVLGTRTLIDFCAGVGFNVGTNVIGPPAGTFDSNLIELGYKTINEDECKLMLSDLVL
jgi:CubicO group peptidase (beta-lactamase class C family)